MPEEKVSPAIVIPIGLGVVMLGVLGILSLAGAALGRIALSAGWNDVTYTGPRQAAGVAMQSIIDYWQIALYYDPVQEAWVQILYETMLEPGMSLSIKVSEDCIWTF